MTLNIKEVNVFKVVLTLLVFIITFQVFFYSKDLANIYLMAKIIPFPIVIVISIIFMIYNIYQSKLIPHTSLMFLFGLLILQSAIMSALKYEQPFHLGIFAQIKLYAVLFYYFLLWYFISIKIKPLEIKVSLILLGVVSLLAFYGLNSFLAPEALYEKSSVFVRHNLNKGFRFKFYTIFLIISYFFFLRSGLKKKKLSYFVIPIAILFYLILYQKQRFEIISVIVTSFFLISRHFEVKYFFILVIIGLVALIGVFELSYFREIVDQGTFEKSSISLRMASLSVSVEQMFTGFANFVFGNGYLNPDFKLNFRHLYGRTFFTSDIGWFGILFELGAVGVIVFVIFYKKLFAEIMLNKQDDFTLSLKDFLLFTLVLSVISPKIMVVNGIFSSILAILVYNRLFKTEEDKNEAR